MLVVFLVEDLVAMNTITGGVIALINSYIN